MENNFQPYTSQNNTETPARSFLWLKIIIIAFASIILLGLILFALSFLPQSKKIINSLYPTAKNTIALAERKLSGNYNYNENIQSQYSDKIILSDVSTDAGTVKNYKINTVLPTTITNSTVGDLTNVRSDVIFFEGQMFVQDPYDNSYYSVGSDTEQYKFVQQITLPPENLLRWVKNYEKDLSIKSTQSNGHKIFEISVNKIPDFIVKNYNLSSDFGKTILNIDDDYLVISFSILPSENSIIKITGSISNFNDENFIKIRKPENINEFGSFVQRESVYIRTEPNGLYDKLWNQWETKYFNCKQCVNKFWKGKNGLTYFQDFIFGVNPLNEDNDYEKLNKNQNPFTSTQLPAQYIAAKDLLIKDLIGVLGRGNIKIGNAFVRDSVVILNGDIPLGAKFLQFKEKFVGNKDNSIYFTVFIDDKLIYLRTLTPGEKMMPDNTELANAPVSDFAGKKGNITFILNSFGPPGGTFNVDINSLKFIYE